MKTMHGARIGLRTPMLLATLAWASAAGAHPIAGLEPYQRPSGAPTISAPTPEANALQGVIKPVPQNIDKFMKDQGNWHTPFTRPGMPGPYDIRGWHTNPSSSGTR